MSRSDFGETELRYRLTRALAAPICDKYNVPESHELSCMINQGWEKAGVSLAMPIE